MQKAFERLVSRAGYMALARVAAILSILAMAVQNGPRNQFINDAWYSGMMVVIVVGPGLLEKLGETPDGRRPMARVVRLAPALLPFLGALLSFALFVAPSV